MNNAINAIIDNTPEQANDLSDLFYNGPVETPGVYEAYDQVYVVKYNQTKTRLYAKVWSGSNLDYVVGAVYKLHPCHKVSRERGEQLSMLFGACCVCGRTLTDPNSVKAGIGPVCGRSFTF